MKSGQPGPCLENGGELPALTVFRRLVSVTVYQVEEAEVAYCLPDAQVDTYDYLNWYTLSYPQHKPTLTEC